MDKIKGIIFDFDGTLVSIHLDFGKIKEQIISFALNDNLKIPDNSLPILELVESIVKSNKGKKNSLFRRKAMEILEKEEMKSAEKSMPVPDCVNFLQELKQKNLKIGIITRNCRKAVLPAIKKHNFPFDVLLTRDDVKKVKPNPHHLKKALASLGLKPSEVIVAGDHPFDIRIARKLKIKNVAIMSGTAKREDFLKENPDLILKDIKEIVYYTGFESLPPGKIPNQFLDYLLKKYIQNDKSVIIGPKTGIDCAVLRCTKNILIAKSDPVTLVGKDTGNYLVNVNVNDIAVMGGVPRWFLTVLIFPAGTTFPQIEEIFRQISNECKKLGINWVGGHTEISTNVERVVASGLIFGHPVKKKFKIPKPKKGNALILVKEIGIEGASIIAREKFDTLKKSFSSTFLKKAMNSVNQPGISVFKESVLLWKHFNISAMHDPTEGGISGGIYEMAEAYNVGFEIYKDKLLFYKPALKLSEYFKLSPFGLISSGCILAITTSSEAEKIKNFLMIKRKVKCEIIGKVTDKGKGVNLIYNNGKTVPFPVFKRDEINRLF